MSTDVIYQNHEAIIPTKKRTNTDIPMQEFEKTYNSMHANQGAAFTEQFQVLHQEFMYDHTNEIQCHHMAVYYSVRGLSICVSTSRI